jgi:hypothetical protein
MDSQDPIRCHFHQPIDSVALWILPVALQSDRHCLRGERSDIGAIFRIDPDIKS